MEYWNGMEYYIFSISKKKKKRENSETKENIIFYSVINQMDHDTFVCRDRHVKLTPVAILIQKA